MPEQAWDLALSKRSAIKMATNLEIAPGKLASVNPATGEVLRELESAGDREIQQAVARARAVQPAWFELGTRQRIARLKRFQQLLQQRKSAVAQLITREAGKPYVEALTTEVVVVLDAVRFLIENAYGILRIEPVRHGNLAMKPKVGHLLREPYGVIGIISPWNYPFSIPATQGLAALVAGNAVVLKPSELTSLVAFELAELVHAAGIPPHAFQVVVGNGATGKAVADSEIDKLIFTGSAATGRVIGERAARRFLP